MRNRWSHQNFEGWLRRKTARAQAYAPATTATPEAASSAAATLTAVGREPVTARELCIRREPVKIRGVCALPITHNLAKRQNERRKEREGMHTAPEK